MAPRPREFEHTVTSDEILETDICKTETYEAPKDTKKEYKLEIVWRNVAIYAVLHVACAVAVYRIFTSAKWQTTAWAVFLYILSKLSITAGVHRLWAHRSYKAKWPLRAFLAFLNCIAFENSIYSWCRDHRVHHKYSETDADPVNVTRGFFFAHCGWLMCKKHPDVQKIGGKVDLSDVLADPIVAFQKKYYLQLVLVFCWILPIWIPMHFWGETYWNAALIPGILRWICSLHATWLVNSAAHMFGDRPYDHNIAPTENHPVSVITLGEGFHNYHHVFPFDYTVSEYGIKLNPTTLFIDAMAWLGQAYDLKRVSPDMIERRKKRTGPKEF